MDDIRTTPDDGLWPLLERSFDGVLLVAANPWRVLRANPTAAELLGTPPSDLIGRSIGELFRPESRDVVFHQLEHGLHGDANDERALAKLLPAEGRERLVGFRVCRVIVDGAIVMGVLLHGVHSSVAKFARLDPLTGLPDRTVLESRLSDLLHGGQKHGDFAVLFVDINNFKEVNDRYGHLVGDRVLREAARLLWGHMSLNEWPMRYGGDEFVVLVDGPTAPEHIERLVSKIKAAMAQPIAVPDGVVTLSVSVGVAIGRAEFHTPEDVLAAADRAMYAAKRKQM